MDKLCYRIPEAIRLCPAIGSRSRAYELMAEGKLHAIKSGKFTLITHKELLRFAQSRPDGPPKRGAPMGNKNAAKT